MKNRKKKRFKLIKHNHKQFPKGGVILQPSDQQAEYITNLYRNIIKEAPSLKPILEYQKENLEKEKAFDKYLDEWFDNIKNGISNIDKRLTDDAKECAKKLKALAEIEFLNQNHKSNEQPKQNPLCCGNACDLHI